MNKINKDTYSTVLFRKGNLKLLLFLSTLFRDFFYYNYLLVANEEGNPAYEQFPFFCKKTNDKKPSSLQKNKKLILLFLTWIEQFIQLWYNSFFNVIAQDS